MSTGRVPMAHPPGKETLADLCLASKGPKTKILLSWFYQII
jgi:hypothetical protein